MNNNTNLQSSWTPQPNLTQKITLMSIWSIVKHYSLKDPKIKMVRLSWTLHPLTTLSRFSNNGTLLNPLITYTHITTKLIVNYHNLITTDNEAHGLLHVRFCKLRDNVMHGFNHLPISGIVWNMFPHCVFHIKFFWAIVDIWYCL